MSDTTSFDAGRAAVYAPHVLPSVPRLLSGFDREPASASHGAADREWWAWKFRDYPVSMPSMATWPLALMYAYPWPESPYHQNERLAGWIGGALEYLIGLQHSNGAFDSVAPYSQDHGTSLALGYTAWATAGLLGDALPPSLRERVREMVGRAAAFGYESHEGYAFITNHQGLAALGFQAGFEATGEQRYAARVDTVIGDVLAHQNEDGWFAEYDGFDPGYETLAILYLAKLWERSRDETLLAALGRSIGFLSHAIHLDGSIGGTYGRRYTRLFAPGGFEKLAHVVPAAASVATFMRDRLGRGNTPVPGRTDAHNLPVYSYAFLEAALVTEPGASLPPERLPCQSFRGVKAFGSGLAVAGREGYYAVAEVRRGGLLRVFSRADETLAYEDAGWIIDSSTRRWTTQAHGMGEGGVEDDHTVSARTLATEVRTLLPSPFRFMVLRLLNLTAFRVPVLSRWILGKIVRRLVVETKPGALSLNRRIVFEEHGVRIEDSLESASRSQVDRLRLVRSFTGIHMGSTRYALAQDLTPVPEILVDTAGSGPDVRMPFRARIDVALGKEGGCDISIGDSDSPRDPSDTIPHPPQSSHR